VRLLITLLRLPSLVQRAATRVAPRSHRLKKFSQIVLVPAFVLPSMAAIACSGSDPSDSGGRAGAGSSGAAQAGSSAQAGSTAQAGSVSTAGGGAAGAATGGAGAGGASAGTASGGSSGAGNPAAGAAGQAGAGAGGSGGGAAGQSGNVGGGAGSSGGSSDITPGLDGLRVDDPCTGTPDTSTGAVCNHVVLTNGGFKSAKDVTIAGTPGTTYDVTLRVRGIVECTQIDGGTRPDTSTFSYSNMTWRKVPFTIGGTANHADYSQWRITTASPKQEYFLNDYQKVGHFIFKLDYQVTIQVAANSKLTLDGNDSNERQIVNYEKYTLDGIPGSMNYGQFIQLNVVSVKPH